MDFGVINETDGNKIVTADFVTGTFTRDISIATGTQAVTGVGFKPSYITFGGTISSTIRATWGADDGTTGVCTLIDGVITAWATRSVASIDFDLASGNNCRGNIQSFDSDGFTISWVKTNSPTGTANILFTAFK